ncbi:MAG: glycosyltransferase [Deltaproteobacteria bacterium]|nr:glycosyltransferase [Deltaproteobacteria bacterium]
MSNPACTDISVIIPVYNRTVALERLLLALLSQDIGCDRFEVLLCDDGSTEDYIPVLRRMTRLGLKIIYLRQENAGPGAARNLGLAHASGEIIAFTDSDCVPNSRWLSTIVRIFEENGVGIVGGHVGFGSHSRLSSQCGNYLMSSSIGAAGARAPTCLISMKYQPRTCNMAVRRQLALRAGGFTNRRYGEDIEFSHKVHSLGVACRYSAKMSVDHHENRGLLGVLRESFNKGVARIYLKKKYGLHQPIHAAPALFVACLAITLCLLRLSLVMFWTPYLLLVGITALCGAFYIRDWRAIGVIPILCVLMHMGYGTGYLFAVTASLRTANRLPKRKPAYAHDGP